MQVYDFTRNLMDNYFEAKQEFDKIRFRLFIAEKELEAFILH